jgi:hypothetical protein
MKKNMKPQKYLMEIGREFERSLNRAETGNIIVNAISVTR